jgi:hypothetical protein
MNFSETLSTTETREWQCAGKTWAKKAASFYFFLTGLKAAKGSGLLLAALTLLVVFDKV